MPPVGHLPHDVDVVVLGRRAPLAAFDVLAGVVDAEEPDPGRLEQLPGPAVPGAHGVGPVLLAVDGAAEGVDDDEGDAEAAGHVDDRPATARRVERGEGGQRGVVQVFEGVGVVVAHVLEPFDDVATVIS